METRVLQRYPVGRKEFSIIRKEGFLYVDKTDLVYGLTHIDSSYIFLSRPRRFGKSLLVSTLKAYFEGKKDLFKGLKIENLEKEWKEYTVLHIDFTSPKPENPEELKSALNVKLDAYEKIYGRDEKEQLFGDRLSGVIKRAYEKTGKGVVVLIDEYDSPLLNVIDTDCLKDVRGIMRDFYSALKSQELYLKFVEIKLDKSSKEAIKQIDEKRYAKIMAFKNSKQKVYKLGINFSSATRTIDDFIIEPI